MARKDKKRAEEEAEELKEEAAPKTSREGPAKPKAVEEEKEAKPVTGEIVLKDGNKEGLSAQINIIENVKVEQEHDMSVKAFDFGGNLQIKNPSTVDRLWDIHVTMKNVEKTNLEAGEIFVRELGTEEENNADSREFALSGKAESRLLAKEFVSTLPEAYEKWNISELEKELLKGKSKKEGEEVQPPKPEEGGKEKLPLESFGIAIKKVNKMQFLIAVRSVFEKPIKEVKIVKNISSAFQNLNVVDTSSGETKLEKEQLTWTIEELAPETTAFVKVAAEIQVETKDPVKTGTIEITYKAASSFTGELSVDKFDAYTRNKFDLDLIEKDDKPGAWDCGLLFDNLSEFAVEVYKTDLHTDKAPDKQLLTIPEDAPVALPAGAQWKAPTFELESDETPAIRRKIEFRVAHALNTEVSGTIAVGDVDLVLASIFGELSYALPEEEKKAAEEKAAEEAGKKIIYVPTFKESEVNAILKVSNDGSAPLNEVTVTQTKFTDQFQPPKAEEIKLLWDGKEVPLKPEQIIVEKNTFKVALKDLKDTDTGMFKADSTLEYQYPVHVSNPTKDAKFDSDVLITANTYPLSEELEYRPEAAETPVIEAIHVRRKYRVGKDISHIGKLGEYKIVLSVENIGNMPLQKMVLMDKIPDNFTPSEFSLEPTKVTDEKGFDIVKWDLDDIPAEKKLEVSYKIKGKGEYSPSDAQVSY